jgi:hypothetical protein
MKSNTLTVTKKILLYLLVVLSIVAISRLFFFEYRLLNYPYQWELRETLQFYHGSLLSEGKSIYAVSPDPPVVLEPYGPVNPLLLSVAVKIFGKNLSGPRLFSFLAFLILLLLIAAAVYRLTHSWMYALIAIGINTFILSWVQWLLLCRPDSLGGMLLFASIFVHWLYPFRKAAVGASLFLIILAFFTKTYFALGLMLIPLNYWFFHRNRRMAVLYLLSGSALLLASIAAAQSLTGGLYYLFTFKLMSEWVTYSFVHLLETMRGLFVYFLPLFALIVYAIVRKEFRYGVLNVFWIYILAGIPIFMFFLLNTGAETYYWYAVIPALTLAGVDVLHKECQKEKSWFAVAMLVLLFSLMTNKMIISETIKDGMVFPSEKLAVQWQPVVAEFDRNADRILNDDATAILAIRAGKEPYRVGLGYLNIKNTLEKRFGYKFKDINAEIANREYALIINPENESYVQQYYRFDRIDHVPVQLGKTYSLKMYVPQ